VVAEVLFPSFGLLGLLATLSVIGANVMAFQHGSGVSFLIVTGVLVPIVILGGFKLLPRSPLGKHLVSDGFSRPDARAVDERDQRLVGAVGSVEAPLRPAGVARFDDRRVDVVSRGEAIGVGERVRVVELKGNRVVVARLEPQTAPVQLDESVEA
jgi:membrane-bound serine protease (ClpP class)